MYAGGWLVDGNFCFARRRRDLVMIALHDRLYKVL